MRHRRAIIMSVLAVFVLLVLGLSVLFAAGPTPQYDTNSSGIIERDEAHNALSAYFDGDLTQEQTLDVLFHYWAAQPVDQPASAASSRPTSVSSPTPTAMSIPTLAPTMTVVRLTPDGIQVNWEHRSQDVTGYELRYRPEDGAWATRSGSKNVSGISFGANSLTTPITFKAGVQYEIQVRSLTRNGASPWASEFRVVPAYTPTPTPALPTPTPLPTPYPSSMGKIGCDGKELLSGHKVGFYYPQVKIASDVMLVSHFHNTWKGIPGRPTPTPEGYRPWHTPTPLSFNYGFTVREVSEGRDSVGLVVRATHEGRWFLELKGCRGPVSPDNPYGCYLSRNSSGEWVTPPAHAARTFHVIDSGNFSDDGVEFAVDSAGVNHMAFVAKGDEYRFIVNGVEVPIELDADDRAAIERYVGRFRYVSDGKWYGTYGSFGSARVAIRERDFNGGPVYLSTYPSVGACVP